MEAKPHDAGESKSKGYKWESVAHVTRGLGQSQKKIQTASLVSEVKPGEDDTRENF